MVPEFLNHTTSHGRIKGGVSQAMQSSFHALRGLLGSTTGESPELLVDVVLVGPETSYTPSHTGIIFFSPFSSLFY